MITLDDRASEAVLEGAELAGQDANDFIVGVLWYFARAAEARIAPADDMTVEDLRLALAAARLEAEAALRERATAIRAMRLYRQQAEMLGAMVDMLIECATKG